MDKNIRRKFLEENFCDNRELAEKAIERIEKGNPFAFTREKIVRCKEIDESLFFGDIDKMVTFLGELKKQGYSRLVQVFHGYDNTDFLAEYDDDETDEEMLERFCRIVMKEVLIIENEIKEENKKNAKIAALEKELKLLKGE